MSAKDLKEVKSAFGDVNGFPDLRQSLTSKDFHLSTENNPYIYKYVGLSNYV